MQLHEYQIYLSNIDNTQTDLFDSEMEPKQVLPLWICSRPKSNGNKEVTSDFLRGCCFQDLFKTACSILVKFLSSFFSKDFVIV